MNDELERMADEEWNLEMTGLPLPESHLCEVCADESQRCDARGDGHWYCRTHQPAQPVWDATNPKNY